MSKINVDTWEPESGTAATLMATGDTVTLPSGAILAVASGGDINVASGGEIDIASGATLDVNGTIDLTGATKTGFPAGGLTHASQWFLTADFTNDATPIITNLIEADAPAGYGRLGDSMTMSSGIFTFPETGIWQITFTAYQTNANYMEGRFYITTTIDDGTYVNAAFGAHIKAQSAGSGVGQAIILFDVTDTTQCKCKFNVTQEGATVTTKGDSAVNETYITFLRLADT